MNAARPIVRMGQRWLFQGQEWWVQETLSDGIIVLGGDDRRRQIRGVYADELYDAGELLKEAPANNNATAKIAKAFEQAQAKLANAKPKRPKKPKPGASFWAWRINLLAVDTAANSGWSLWSRGKCLGFGEVRITRTGMIEELCRKAHALEPTLPTVLLLESAAGMVYQGRGASVLVGLGRARQVWLHAWKCVGGIGARVVSVKPTRWRGEIMPRVVRGLSTPEREQQMAKLIIKEHFGEEPESVPPDAAAALCIGRFGTHAGEVGLCLPSGKMEVVR